jgi:hypothetical protein
MITALTMDTVAGGAVMVHARTTTAMEVATVVIIVTVMDSRGVVTMIIMMEVDVIVTVDAIVTTTPAGIAGMMVIVTTILADISVMTVIVMGEGQPKEVVVVATILHPLCMLMHAKCMHELCSLLMHIPTYYDVISCFNHVLQ